MRRRVNLRLTLDLQPCLFGTQSSPRNRGGYHPPTLLENAGLENTIRQNKYIFQNKFIDSMDIATRFIVVAEPRNDGFLGVLKTADDVSGGSFDSKSLIFIFSL